MISSTDHRSSLNLCPVRWSTAAFSDAADTSPLDLQSLSAHVEVCSGQPSRSDRLHHVASWAGGMVRVRLMTCVVVVVMVLGAVLALAA